MDTLYRFATEHIELALEGSEDFVREEMEQFQALLMSSAGITGADGSGERDASTLKGWYEQSIRPGQNPTMQDHILIFAYFLHKVKRQFVFTPDDMKASFSEIGREVPKSLLQIMGSLKRDHNLLWPGDKRGEYCLLPSGIQHVERVLGIQREGPQEAPEPTEQPGDPAIGVPAPEPTSEQVNVARQRFSSLFTAEEQQTSEEPD